MKIWVYTIAYNEAHFVKNFLRAYSQAEKIIVYDNMSTDNTVSLLKEDHRVEVRIHDSGGEIRDDLYLQIKNNCWKEARGIADWVIVVDFDEIFTRAINPGIFDLYLDGPELKDIDIIRPNGYMIYEENMPLFRDYNPLSPELKGIYDLNSQKLCCFRPDRIKEINYDPGCHSANPVGMNGGFSKHWQDSNFRLIHFKYINITHYFHRLAQYKERMSQYNLSSGFGVHYTWSYETHKDIYMKGLIEAKPLFEIQKP